MLHTLDSSMVLPVDLQQRLLPVIHDGGSVVSQATRLGRIARPPNVMRDFLDENDNARWEQSHLQQLFRSSDYRDTPTANIPMTAEAGVALMVVTAATFAASDSVVKVIGSSVPLVAILFGRYLIQAIALGVWQTKAGFGRFRHIGTLKLQVLRAFLLLLNSACTFAGLRLLPLPVSTP
ncbi:hypothetical protein V4C56_12660 [Paraburkholderia azotifigens]|uniref:Uncharacterized protein n=1 Tax=Paraburkholderia azotifigens TaxID=2057004 RepID=A0ABU9R1B6_9BURK